MLTRRLASVRACVCVCRNDDLARHRSDTYVNNREVLRLVGSSWTKCKWYELVTGDIVKVLCDEQIPADLFLLSSSNDASEAYVETAELDGYVSILPSLFSS